jgi:3-oxoacyl-[acyl-carrier-protein] synthase II
VERYEFSSDRRGFPRILSGYPVDIKIENPPAGIPPSISGEIGNLSNEGASLILDNSFPVSSLVTLRLDLSPEYSPIETKAQVMWGYFLEKNKRFNCGVRFLDLEEKYREILNRIIGEGMENNRSVPERRKSDRRATAKELKQRLWKAEMLLKKVKKTMDRRVVITGLGVVAPNGIGKEEFWEANLEGKSGVDLIEDFDVSLFNSKIAAQIKKIDPLDFVPKEVAKRVDRFVHLGLSSCKLALDDSKLNLNKEDKTKIGILIGSGLGGVIFHEEQILAGYEKGAHRLNPLCVPRITPNAVASHIAIQYNLLGPNIVISTACSSGTIAIGEATRKIQNNDIDICIAGGTEAPLTQFTFGAYCALKVLSKKNSSPQEASRPFDKKRDGFVLGEGSAILVLEELNHAKKRGAHIYAEIIGYSCNSGAYHMVMPEPTGKDIVKTIIDSLKDAQIKPTEIDYINAHGTSTLQNDRIETKAIKEVFGNYAYKIPISSTKSMIGHTIGAAGAIEAVVCCLTIENQIIPPTINYNYPDPECDLDYVPNKPREAKIKTILSNSFGFGSNNACLIISGYNE